MIKSSLSLNKTSSLHSCVTLYRVYLFVLIYYNQSFYSLINLKPVTNVIYFLFRVVVKMSNMIVLLTVVHFLCVNGLVFDSSSPINIVSVHTNVGEIQGRVESVNFAGQYYQVKEFLGIPFAEPPVGNNRFKKPITKAPFKSPFLAFHYGASCIQPSFPENWVSEDCLFLNVFVPVHTTTSIYPLPVMVWIHGGGFIAGSSTVYPGDILSAFGEAIVVTINYRLAHLGFLWTDEGMGNFGLWDQHMAIKWVSDNIAQFGGDVSRITIFGESAGSSSVVYQALYAGNKHLFQRAIAQSGSITSSWGFAPRAIAEKTFANFSGEMGCRGNRNEIMSCLRGKPSSEIIKVMNSTTLNFTMVVPNKDYDFAPQHPRFMLSSKTANKDSLDFFQSLDFVMGCTSSDGSVFLGAFAEIMNISDAENLNIPRDIYEDFFIPTTIASVFKDLPSIPDVMKEATVFEYTNWSDPDNHMARNKMLVKLMSHAELFAPTVATVNLHAEGMRGRSYLYEFSVRPQIHYIGVPSWQDGPTVSQHADDLAYVFGYTDGLVKFFRFDSPQFGPSAQDITISKRVMTMWTNFAKTG